MFRLDLLTNVHSIANVSTRTRTVTLTSHPRLIVKYWLNRDATLYAISIANGVTHPPENSQISSTKIFLLRS